MADTYLSTLWYRVADLRPRLRSHVKVHRHRYRGQAWYVLHDHASGRVHRFTPGAYLVIGQMDGGRSVDDVWQSLADSYDEDAPGQDEIIQLLSRLHQNDLIQYKGSPDVADLLERYDKQSRQLWKQNLTNPVSFRVPLWDPDRFLTATMAAVRPLTGWFGLVLWLIVVTAGLVTAALHFDELTSNLSDRLLATSNIAITLVTYPLLKALHELTHGYLVKARGGEVREMGVMFLVFFPVPYVDASAAGAFRNKWHRAAVSAGGIFVETFVAAIAVIVWAQAEPGLLSAVAYNLVLIGGLSTIVVNGNPLLKFDGYYVLSDLIESPNFSTRATRYWGYLIQRYLFAARQLKEEIATSGERVWFVIYAPLAFVYRMMVMLGIALLVAQKAFIIGVLIAIWSVFNAVVKPAVKHIRHVMTSPQLRKVRRRATTLTFGTIAVCVGVLMLVPLPLRTDTEGVIWLPDNAYVRARTDGVAQGLTLATGTQLEQDAIVARMRAPRVSARIDVLSWRVEEFRRRLSATEVQERSQTEVVRLQLAEAQAELVREMDRAARLDVRTSVGGRFAPVLPASEMDSRHVAEGDLIAYVLPPAATIARAVVTQDDIALVRDRLRGVELKLAGHLSDRFSARVLRDVPSATTTLPSAALGPAGGGRFLTDPGDPDGLAVINEVFLLDLALPPELAQAPFGARVFVRFDHGYEPAGLQIWRRMRQLFLRTLNA
ncbi:PqqD family peptide modification chaperone [Pseudosulfitobacter sp. DSM 107133]|uniref:PqqD family peptide modification chaperone n=1 Tax=Pseudosulfitobacter sp. DSM 107133 TaxID=2883100 RepID=UPI000DF135D6|nr:PqqD family peptide modification chaperone [Pseudosulfitobacter sp. DSM 107133]UOA28929.1 Coenzyme PQQ synthesis protein D [Pseudosulfitobacter sp. DSM 107133]